MKIKNLFLLALVAVSMSFASCGDDVDCTETNIEQELESEFTALSDAGTAYFTDPTNSVACEAYRDAINDYIDAIESYRECLNSTEEEEFDESIAEFRTVADDLEC